MEWEGEGRGVDCCRYERDCVIFIVTIVIRAREYHSLRICLRTSPSGQKHLKRHAPAILFSPTSRLSNFAICWIAIVIPKKNSQTNAKTFLISLIRIIHLTHKNFHPLLTAIWTPLDCYVILAAV